MAKRLDKNLTRLVSLTIANGATTSNTATINDSIVEAVIFPAALTGTGLTFSTSWDNSTFYVPNVAGTDVTLAKQNSKLVPLKESVSDYASYWGPYVKVSSSGAEGAARTILLVVRQRS